MVTNSGPTTIKAYSIQWTIHFADGTSTPYTHIYVSRHIRTDRDNRIIRPGETRLISPLFNVSRSEFTNDKYFADFYRADLISGVGEKVLSVEAYVDGEVMIDGSFVGPNKTLLLQKYRCYRNADHDEAVSLLKDLDTSSSPFHASQLLRADMATGVAAQPIMMDIAGLNYDVKTTYRRARSQSAGDYLSILQERGVSGLMDALHRMANEPPAEGFTHMNQWF